jgi:hypothetical protein
MHSSFSLVVGGNLSPGKKEGKSLEVGKRPKFFIETLRWSVF